MDTINFRMNDRDIIAAEGNDFPLDEEAYLEVQAGDTIVLYDVSSPRSAYSSNSWDLNSNFIIDKEDKENMEFVPVVFDSPGTNKITLCVNGSTQCVSKWVKVTGRGVVVDNTDPAFKVISPPVSGRRSSGKTANVKVKTTNILNKEDINITVNSKPLKKFTFDRDKEELTMTVPLSRKSNEVVLAAVTNAGSTKKNLTLETTAYDARKPPVSSKPKPPVIGVGRAVTIESKTTQSSRIDLEFSASGVSKRNIKVTSNGKPIAASSIFLKRGEGVVRNLPLEMGLNEVLIVASNAGGKSTSRYAVTRIPEKQTVLNTPPPPVISEPAPPPPIRSSAEPTIGWLGAQSAGNCSTKYSASESTVRLKPAREVFLMGATVYSSGCGRVIVTLAQGRNTISEPFEIREGRNQLPFDKLQKDLNPNIEYRISLKVTDSPECKGSIPTLADASSCGKSSSGDAQIALKYDKAVSLFEIKYQF